MDQWQERTSTEKARWYCRATAQKPSQEAGTVLPDPHAAGWGAACRGGQVSKVSAGYAYIGQQAMVRGVCDTPCLSRLDLEQLTHPDTLT